MNGDKIAGRRGASNTWSGRIADPKRVVEWVAPGRGLCGVGGRGVYADEYAAAVAIVARRIPDYSGRIVSPLIGSQTQRFYERMGNPPEGKARLERQSPLSR